MIRNLKALGLALVALFAMSALSASTASAAEQGVFTTEAAKPATLKITETGTTFANALTSFGSSTHCPGTTYTGHKYNVTPHELVPSGATTLTVTPHYATKCTATGERQATVTTNGCDFVFHVGKTVTAGQWPVTADVVCPNAENGIHVGVWEKGATEHNSGNRLCTLEVTPQTGLAGANVTNAAGSPDHLNVQGTFTKIHVERTGLCIFDGKGSTTTEGQFHLDVTAKAVNSEGGALGVTISD